MEFGAFVAAQLGSDFQAGGFGHAAKLAGRVELHGFHNLPRGARIQAREGHALDNAALLYGASAMHAQNVSLQHILFDQGACEVRGI